MFIKRLYQYQKERFPVAVHGVLIAAFSFSAIGYSRQLRGAEGFISLSHYALCLFSNLAVFFLLRVADEHKDKEDDEKYRAYLPVPRGLISLRELRICGYTMLLAAIALNALFAPAMLPLLGLTLGYLLLMRYEFFAAAWLRRNLGFYMLSHMLIIPLADIYASGFDWNLAGLLPSAGLLFFFGVSYFNGIVLEIGRKLRAPGREEEGVETYTMRWGQKKAPSIWLLSLSVNFCLALLAVHHAGYPILVSGILSLFFVLALIPGILFLRSPTPALSKWIEGIALLWALAMYLSIGGVPQLLQLAR